MEEISLRDIYYIIRKRLWLIAALLIVAVLISAGVSFFVLDKEYQANTTLMIGRPADYITDRELSISDLNLNQKLVSTYGELIKTRTVAMKVIDNLDLPYSYNTLRGKLNVKLVQNTEIISITVNDENPELAAQIANETAIVFMETVKDIMKVENVQVIDVAEVPTGSVSPRPMLNIAIAAVLGVMLGVFITFLIEFLDNTIKTPEDVEKHLGLPVLGAIPMVED